MPRIVLLLLIGPILFTFAVGCGRFPSSEPKVETTTPDPESSSSNASHKLECTEAELNKSACQHGGVCFATNAPGGTRDWGCDCPKPYLPPRCHDIDANLFWNDYQRPSNVASAGIAASVVAVVLFVTLIICIAVWRRRYLKKKKEEERQKQADQNGALMKAGEQNDESFDVEKEYPLKFRSSGVSNGNGQPVYRNSINLSDIYPMHRNSAGQLTATPPQGDGHADRPKSYNSNYTNHYPSSDPRSSKFDPYPDIQFADDDAEEKNLLPQNSSPVIS